jgi:transcriptional regulator NrdR family protein
MNCPECKAGTKVLETRMTAKGHRWRRRECIVCSHRFTTTEWSRQARTITVRVKKSEVLDKLRSVATLSRYGNVMEIPLDKWREVMA